MAHEGSLRTVLNRLTYEVIGILGHRLNYGAPLPPVPSLLLNAKDSPDLFPGLRTILESYPEWVRAVATVGDKQHIHDTVTLYPIAVEFLTKSLPGPGGNAGLDKVPASPRRLLLPHINGVKPTRLSYGFEVTPIILVDGNLAEHHILAHELTMEAPNPIDSLNLWQL